MVSEQALIFTIFLSQAPVEVISVSQMIKILNLSTSGTLSPLTPCPKYHLSSPRLQRLHTKEAQLYPLIWKKSCYKLSPLPALGYAVKCFYKCLPNPDLFFSGNHQRNVYRKLFFHMTVPKHQAQQQDLKVDM